MYEKVELDERFFYSFSRKKIGKKVTNNCLNQSSQLNVLAKGARVRMYGEGTRFFSHKL